MTLSRIHQKVHCHICPLKDVCLISEAEASYRYQHYWNIEDYPKGQRDFFNIDMKRVDRATTNCPLKKLLST